MINPSGLAEGFGGWSLPPKTYASGGARGLYNPMQFVVRLHPDLHEALAGIPLGTYRGRDVNPDSVLAFSTYLHETVHWWQHVGSTAGFVLNLAFPSQAHLNHHYLKRLLDDVGPFKSLRQYHNANASTAAPELAQTLNIVLNNWYDIESCRWLILRPDLAREVVGDPYFECVGHSYKIAWATCLWLISGVGDPTLDVIPDPRRWDDAFTELGHQEQRGYFYGSPIHLPPIGAWEIFEGQARFAQLQYLHFASGRTADWSDFEQLGMLEGVYIRAFNLFVRMLETSKPASVDHPLVALFLLVCDLALNPSEGLPFDIRFFETFILDVDPGTRFLRLTRAIRERHFKLLTSIVDYSRDQYIEAAETLSRELLCPSPMAAAAQVAAWQESTSAFRHLMDENATFQFDIANLPVRVLLARFVAFQRDKLTHPEFFAWPGVWLSDAVNGILSLEQGVSLFKEHEALFIDTVTGEVQPRLIPGRDKKKIKDTFDTFYSWTATYDLVRQWHVEDGPFDLSYEWLTKRYTTVEMAHWASEEFRAVYGTNLNQFTVL